MFGYGRDDGVAESSKSVHPRGNPISHSTKVGDSGPGVSSATTVRRFRPPPRPEFPGPPIPSAAVGVGNHDPRSRCAIDGADWFAFAVGVCNNEDAVTEVRGADGCRWDAVPFRVEPDLGQVPEYSSKPERKVACDVLQDRVSGS